MKREGGKNREVTMTRDKDWTYIETRRVAIEHAREVQLLHFFFEAAREAGVHAQSAREHDVLLQLRADVDRRTLDRLESAQLLDIDWVWLGQALGRLELFRADLDRSAIGKLTNAISLS
jgi:hypothetical protein